MAANGLNELIWLDIKWISIKWHSNWYTLDLLLLFRHRKRWRIKDVRSNSSSSCVFIVYVSVFVYTRLHIYSTEFHLFRYMKQLVWFIVSTNRKSFRLSTMFSPFRLASFIFTVAITLWIASNRKKKYQFVWETTEWNKLLTREIEI